MTTAVDPNAVGSVLGIKTIFQNIPGSKVSLLPQRVALIGQGASATSYALTKRTVLSASEVGSTYGFGSPLHLAARQLLPENGDGLGTIPLTVYPLDDDGAGVVSTGDLTPGGTPTVLASYKVVVNNIDSLAFLIAVGDTVAEIVTAITAAINGALNMPIIAVDGVTTVDFTSKWQGTSANDIVVSVVGSTTAGNTFVITQPVGGLVNPDVDAATAQVGDVWETMAVSCFEIADTGTLTKYETFGETRWATLVSQPLVFFTGVRDAALATIITVSDARTTDRVNAQLISPGSNDLPLVIAARGVARIAKLANENPPHDYQRQLLTGLVPAADSVQLDAVERETAVTSGSSTITIRDGVVSLLDTVTFFHPVGEQVPAYRYVADIVKLQNILFNISLIFDSPNWSGSPLIPDGQPTSNRTAKNPSMAIAAVATMLDQLGLAAIISDPETAKKETTAAIDGANPKRLNICITIQLSGNVNVISIDLNFGFFFGQ